MVTYWVAGVANESDLSLLLTCFENLEVGENLRMHGERSSDLLDGLGEKIQSFDQLKRLNAIQSKNYRSLVTPTKAVEVAPVQVQDLATLLSEDYRTFSVEKMLGIEEQYSLNHFQFAEVVAAWMLNRVNSNKGFDQNEIDEVWGAVEQHELNEEYLFYLKDVVSSCEWMDISNTNHYQYLNNQLNIEDPLKFENIEHQNRCKMCGTTCRFTVTFHKDRIPCYELEVEDSSCRVEHVYFIFHHHDYAYGDCVSGSLGLTDSYNSVRANSNWESHLDGKEEIHICYLYKCGKK